jgi:hypothetical protein
MSNFEHFDMTYTTVTGKARDVEMLLPHVQMLAREAPTPEWREVVADTHQAICEAVADQPDGETSVTVTYPKPAVAIILEAVGFVDRLLTITQEEIDKAIANRREDA